jgi:hypothetical protein
VTHLDTHKHAHIFPEILTALLRAARICGVRAIRNPIVPVKALPARPVQRQAASLEALRPGTHAAYFFRQFLQRTKRAGLVTPDGVLGVIETGLAPAFPCCARRSPACRREHGSWSAIPAITMPTCAPPHAIARFSRGGAASADFGGTAAVSWTSKRSRVISYREFVERPWKTAPEGCLAGAESGAPLVTALANFAIPRRIKGGIIAEHYAKDKAWLTNKPNLA